jgi:hypothetical protein
MVLVYLPFSRSSHNNGSTRYNTSIFNLCKLDGPSFQSSNSDSALLGLIVTTVREYGVYVLVFKAVFILAGSEVSLTVIIYEVLVALIY